MPKFQKILHQKIRLEMENIIESSILRNLLGKRETVLNIEDSETSKPTYFNSVELSCRKMKSKDTRTVTGSCNKEISKSLENDIESSILHNLLSTKDSPIRLEDGESSDPIVIDSDEKAAKNRKNTKGFPCTICGHLALSSIRLKEHLSLHTGVKQFECDICCKKFAWRYSFKSHMATHDKNNPNKCSTCGKRYSNKSALKNHVFRIHGNPEKLHNCEQCDKAFVTEFELKRHGIQHSEETPFTCEYCGNSFKLKAALVVHYRTHTGERPYKCGLCEKEFVHLSSVISHRLRHSKETPFHCEKCGKKFRLKRALTAHMAMHSDRKPFHCDKCGKSFKYRTGFKVHMDCHLGVKRHKCKYCERPFRAYCNMLKHLKKHLREKTHKCSVCEEAYACKSELKNHSKIHHETKKGENHCTPILHSINAITYAESFRKPHNEIITSNLNITHDQDNHFAKPSNEILTSDISIGDNQGVLYDCSIPDKCNDKSPLISDNYMTQFLCQPVYNNPPALSMYPSEQANRSSCVSNLTNSYTCMANQTYNNYSYNMPHSDDLVIKCKLCRGLFPNGLPLRSHLIEYHRIDEENVDSLF